MRTKRSPGLADLTILVACVAASLGCLMFFKRVVPKDFIMSGDTLEYRRLAASAFLTPFTLAVSVLVMYRVPRRRWANHPAFATGAGVAAALVMGLVFIAAVDLSANRNPIAARYYALTRNLTLHAGGMIAAFAIAAAVGGRIRRPRDWLGWLGVGIGLGWFALWLPPHVVLQLFPAGWTGR